MPQVTYTTDTSGRVWNIWVNTQTTASYNSTSSNYIWETWQNTTSATVVYSLNTPRRYTPPPETAAQRREREAAAERIVEERHAATRKAQALLLSVLSKKQAAELKEKDEFTVHGSKGGVYIIKRGIAGNVRRGRYRYCGHLPGDQRYPQEDHMLAQKLMIETDEEAFLAVANRS